jgi:hypothetical protein
VQRGESLDMFFTLPRELTGRQPEQVRCSAPVAHIDGETGRVCADWAPRSSDSSH